jgi:hypothetical protein
MHTARSRQSQLLQDARDRFTIVQIEVFLGH